MSVASAAETEIWLSLKVSKSVAKKPQNLPIYFVSVPRKIVRLATERNRIKRLIREMVRSSPELQSATGTLYFSVKKRPLRPTLEKVKRQILG